METTGAVRVFVADGSDAVRGRVAEWLAAAGLTVVGQSACVPGCCRAVAGLRVHVVVLDAHLRHGSALELLKAVRSAVPGIRVVVFTHESCPVWRKHWLAAGADCVIDKLSGFELLAGACTSARAGNRRAGVPFAAAGDS